MPEVNFTILLPDGTQRDCYSPSTIVCRYFKKGEEMSVTDFVRRSSIALTEASERVRARYGFSCTSAAAQIAQIEQFSSVQPAAGTVKILNI